MEPPRDACRRPAGPPEDASTAAWILHRSHISLIYQAHISIALICQYQANIKPYQPDIAFSQYQADSGLICQYQADFASLSLLKSSLNRHISLILARNIKRSKIRLILAYQANIRLIMAYQGNADMSLIYQADM